MISTKKGYEAIDFIRAKDSGCKIKVEATDHFFENASKRKVNIALIRRVFSKLAQKPYPADVNERSKSFIVSDGVNAILATRRSYDSILLINAFAHKSIKEDKDNATEILMAKKPNVEMVSTRHFENRFQSRRIDLKIFDLIDKKMNHAYPNDVFLFSDEKHSVVAKKDLNFKIVLITCFKNDIEDWEDFKYYREYLENIEMARCA